MKCPIKPSNVAVNERDPRQCGVLMSLQEVAASGHADIAALIAKFRPEW